MKTLIKKQTLLIVVSILFATTSYAQFGKSIKGNGQITTITRSTGDYDTVGCAGFMDFVLVQGTEGNIKIEGEENLLKYIVTEVKNGNLNVKVKNKINLRSSKNKTIKITIPFKDISKVSLSGSGDVWNTDVINSNNLAIALSGAGDIVLDIKTNSVKGAISGSGDITLKGSTNNLEARISGSGDFHGFELQANNTEVAIAGSGDAKVVSNENLKARVSGSGDIKYRGNPKTDTKVAGSGTIKTD